MNHDNNNNKNNNGVGETTIIMLQQREPQGESIQQRRESDPKYFLDLLSRRELRAAIPTMSCDELMAVEAEIAEAKIMDPDAVVVPI